ncbi:MAG TPA: hypothetical protein VFJ05_07080 [Nitrososphaeraceae archaeon]|nr:hypothetical protein [Nitrososphaeraceae archaeon]
MALASRRKLDSFQKLKNKLRSSVNNATATTSYDLIDDRIKNLTEEQLHYWRTLPFWSTTHNDKGTCCFIDLVGRPVKGGVECPLYPFETDTIIPAFEQHNKIFILKSRGLGATTLSLYWMLYKSQQPAFRDSTMAIVVGPSHRTASDLIKVCRSILQRRLGTTIDSRETELPLPNDVTIRSFPSFHLNSLRSYMNVSIILIDELAYLPSKEQSELMNVINSYREKSNAKIIFVTTPASPDDLAAQINDDPDSSFYKLRLGYHVGLGTMYTPEAIQEQMKEASFEREYNLKFTGMQGNAFSMNDIELAITNDYSYNDHISRDETIPRSCGVDIGAGSSKTGIVITQYRDRQIQVIYAKQFDRPMLTDILEEIIRLTNRHPNCRIFIDASNPLATAELKYLVQDFDARTYAEDKRYVNDINQYFDNRLRVFPVNFLHTHKPMLSHLNEILQSGKLRIHSDFKELITALRTAYVKSDVWDLDKGRTLNDDLLDALRLACVNYRKPTQRASGYNNNPIMITLGNNYY